MTNYFDRLRTEVTELAKQENALFLDGVLRLERRVVQDVSLCTGDREFPHEHRERIQGLIAVNCMDTIGGVIEGARASRVLDYLLTMRAHRLFEELHRAFHEVAGDRIKTRFGILSDDPAGNVWCRDQNDSIDSEINLAITGQQPEHREKFDQMVTMLSVAESKGELEKVALLFVFDMSYSRADICLALKVVEKKKGW